MSYYAPTASRARPGVSVLLLVYLVAGGIIAATHHYWSNLHNIKQIISALLATVLWPPVLLGVNPHIHYQPGPASPRTLSAGRPSLHQLGVLPFGSLGRT